MDFDTIQRLAAEYAVLIGPVVIAALFIVHGMRDLAVRHHAGMPTKCPCCGEDKYWDVSSLKDKLGRDRRQFYCGSGLSAEGGLRGLGKSPRLEPCSPLSLQ